MRRVVITGLGALTALGEGAGNLWEAALRGQSGIAWVDLNGTSSHWKVAGGQVPDFQPEKYIAQRKALKVMARDIQLAVAGASLAMADAGLKDFKYDAERFGVIVGSGVLNHELDELALSIQSSLDDQEKLDLKKFGQDGLASLFPLWLLKYLPNMPACHISIFFDLQGMNNTVTTGASSGLQAVGEAFRILQRGDADLMLAGGAESKLNPVGVSQYEVLGILARNLEHPEKAYRPFDRFSDGLLVGEGAGFLVLEELEHARRRQATIYAEVTGFGCAAPGGYATAMRTAMRQAGVAPSELNYIQACGLGIPNEDALEAEAIGAVVGDEARNISVSASKALTGFTGYSSGALDLILSTLAMKHQKVPAILNCSESSDRRINFVKNVPVGINIQQAMVNTFGLGAPSVSMVIRKVLAS